MNDIEIKIKRSLSDAEKLEIIREALQSPSADNCQPFRFAWNEDTLSIFHLKDRARHFLNFHDLGSHLSLGCLLESLSIAASKVGCVCDWETCLPLTDDVHLAAKCTFEKAKVTPDRLAPHLGKRYTDRRLYSESALPPSFFDELRSESDQMGSCRIRILKPNRGPLIDAICALDQVVWTNRQAQQDLQGWLRLRQSETTRRDGMPWRSLGIGHFERCMLLLCRWWPVQSLLNSLGGLKVSRAVLKRQLCSSGYLCLVTATSSSPEEVTQCGQLSMRTWLALNGAHYGVQPLSLASFLALEYRVDRVAEELPSHQLGLIKKVSQCLTDAFELEEQELPVWLFRTGRVNDMPAYLRSPRLSLAEVMMR